MQTMWVISHKLSLLKPYLDQFKSHKIQLNPIKSFLNPYFIRQDSMKSHWIPFKPYFNPLKVH